MSMWGFLAFFFYARKDTRKSPLYDPRGYLAAAQEGGEGGGDGTQALLANGSAEDAQLEGASRPRHVVWGGALAERIPAAPAPQSTAAPAYTLM